MTIPIGNLQVTLSADGTILRTAMAQANTDALRLVKQFEQLQQRFQLGKITNVEYSASLRTLKADMAELSAGSRLGALATTQLASASAAATAQVQQFGRVARTEFRQERALDAMVLGMGNLVSGSRSAAQGIAGIAASMRILTLTNPQLFALVSVIGLVATAFEALDKATKDEADTTKSLVDRMKEATEEARKAHVTHAQSIAEKRNAVTAAQANVEKIREEIDALKAFEQRVSAAVFWEALQSAGVRSMAEMFTKLRDALNEVNVANLEYRKTAKEGANERLRQYNEIVDRLMLERDQVRLSVTEYDHLTLTLAGYNRQQIAVIMSLREAARQRAADNAELAKSIERINELGAAMKAADRAMAGMKGAGLPTPIGGESLKRLEDPHEAAKRQMRELPQGLKSARGELAKEHAKINEESKVFAKGFTDIFAALGQNIAGIFRGVSGSFRGFLGAIVEITGRIFTQLGELLIESGTAALSLKALMANPFAAIAAGIALVALGAAASAGAQHILSTGGGGGGVSIGAVAAASPSQQQGDLTIIFPRGTVFDPSNPLQLDAFVRMQEAATNRRVLTRTG